MKSEAETTIHLLTCTTTYTIPRGITMIRNHGDLIDIIIRVANIVRKSHMNALMLLGTTPSTVSMSLVNLQKEIHDSKISFIH